MEEYKLIFKFRGMEQVREFVESIQHLLPEEVGFYAVDALDFGSGRAEKNTYILASDHDRRKDTRLSIQDA